MNRIHTTAGAIVAALLACTLATRPALADAHTEAVAKDALQKEGADYSSMNYTAAVARLAKAVQACGTNKCSPATRAVLLRDYGTMQFRAGDKNGAAKSWGDSLALDPTQALNPAFDASDVGAAWEDARASAGLPAGMVSSKPPPGAAATPGPAAHPAGAPTEPAAEQPTGDFEHDPAPEQKENTPLPVHVDYPGNSKLTRVVLKYKGAQMREWARLDLKHTEGTNSYEGTIPCADVTRGTMRYWVQGFDKTGEPVSATGDPKHPYYVLIRDKITTEPPHLPGQEPPRSCEEVDCPPGLAGCKKRGAGGGPETDATVTPGAGDEGEAEKKPQGPHYPRLWVGVSFALDLLSLSSATNVCALSKTAVVRTPLNSAGYYCYDPAAGVDFPPNPTVNNELVAGGTTSSGVQVGDLRAMLSFDYALTPNVLAGARLGYVFNAYPGKAAVHFAPIHIEARATYVLGNAPLTRASLAPMGFAGLGLSEFDGHQSTFVNVNNVRQTVDVWLTNAPFFIVVGAGGRWQFSPRAAITGALRLNLAIGSNGLLPTYGPELGVLYGF